MLRLLPILPNDMCRLPWLFPTLQVDDNGDGQLQMREFFSLFALALDTKGQATVSDITNAFEHLGGDPRDEDSLVDTADVCTRMRTSIARCVEQVPEST